MNDELKDYFIGNRLKGDFKYREIEPTESAETVLYKYSNDKEHFDGVIKTCTYIQNSNAMFVNGRYVVSYSIIRDMINQNKKNDYLFINLDNNITLLCNSVEVAKIVSDAIKCRDQYKLFRINEAQIEEVSPNIGITFD